MRTTASFLILCLYAWVGSAQNLDTTYVKFEHANRPEVRTPMYIPDMQGYKSLKCDFHMHTYFSDGEVTPAMRVAEAWCEGLDAIAITDHNKNKTAFLGADYNKSYDLAKVRGDELGLIVIKAIEYTDRKPVGHLNFLFIDEANQYERKIIEPDAAVELAASKGAFVMYNHPGWPDQNSDLNEFQKKYIAQKKIGGIEVFNQAEFYPQTIDDCLKNGLAVMGSSDSHGPINFEYDLSENQRPMTLVFASEKSVSGIKEALQAGRTLAYANHLLAGREEYIRAIFAASFETTKIREENGRAMYQFNNLSGITYCVEYNGDKVVFPAGKSTWLKVKNSDLNKEFSLINSYCSSKEHARVKLLAEGKLKQ